MGIAGSCLLYPQETKQVNKLYPPHTRGTEDNLAPYQIQRLTNYLSRNPKHLPNVGKYRIYKFIINRVLENRIHKDLYKGRIGYVRVGMLSLNKILESCHNKLALFEEQVINIVLFLLEEPNIDLRLLTLTTFNIYIRYQDDLADKNKLSVFVKELIALSRFRSDNIQKDYTAKLEALRSIMSLILAMDENTLNSNILEIYPVIFENLNDNTMLLPPQSSSSNIDASSAAEPHDTPKSVAFDCLTNIAGVISANSFDTFLNPLLHHLDDIRWNPIEFSIQCMRALCVSMNKNISIPLYLYLLRHAKVLHDCIKSNEFLQPPQSAASSSNILVVNTGNSTTTATNTNANTTTTANTDNSNIDNNNNDISSLNSGVGGGGVSGRVVQSMRLPAPIRQDSMNNIEMTRLRSQTEVDSETAKQCLKNMIPVIVNTIRITRTALTPWIIETIDIFLPIYSYYVLENELEIKNQNMKKSLEDLIIEFENKLKGPHETIEMIDKIMNYNIMSLNLPNERYLLHLIELICSNTKETLPLNDNLLRSIMERIKSDDVIIQLSALKIFNTLLSPEMTSLSIQTSTIRRQQLDDENRQIQSQHSQDDLDQSNENLNSGNNTNSNNNQQPQQPQQKPKIRKLTDFQKQAIFSLLYRGILSCPANCPELLLEYCKTINILLSMDWNTYSSTLFHIALRLQWEAIHDSPIDTSNLSLDDITLRDRPDDYINSMTLDTVVPKPQMKQLLLHLVVSSILYSYQMQLESNELKQYIISVVEYRKKLDGWNHKQIVLDYNTGLLLLLPEEISLANIDEVILEEEEEDKDKEKNKEEEEKEENKKSPCFIKQLLLDYIHNSKKLSTLLLEKDIADYESKLRQVFVLPDYPIAFSIPGQFYPESIVSETVHQSVTDNTVEDGENNSIPGTPNSENGENEEEENREEGESEYDFLLKKTSLKLQQKRIRMQRLEPNFKIKRGNMDMKNDFNDTFKFSITPPSLNYQHM